MRARKETIYIHPLYQSDFPLRLYMTGITHPDADYHIRRPEKNGLYVLEYVISGKGHVRFGDSLFSPVAGDVYFLQPHAAVNYYSDSKDPWEKIWFNLGGPLIKSLCSGYGLDGLIYYHDCPLQELFFRAFEIGKTWNKETSHQFAFHIHQIISALYDWKNQHPEYQKTPEGLCLKEYLDGHWQEKVSLQDLAKLVGKSQVQVLRIFQRDWADTPNNYLQKIRLNSARQYLENTILSVKEISMMLGFQDEFYFSNWFKLKAGISPSRYREKFR